MKSKIIKYPGNKWLVQPLRGVGLVFALVLFAFNPVLAEDWPAYMHDNRRSGVTSESLVLSDLNEEWVYTSPAPPQIAWDGGHPWDSYAQNLQVPMRDFDAAFFVSVVGYSVYFGSSVTDSVHCLDVRSGKQQWFFRSNGPVRYPPSFYDGKLYFGSDDGYAYCIDAYDGSFIWKYSPSPDTRLIANNGKLIPMWPIRTGTAVLDGKCYFAASLVPWRAAYLCSLDAATGSASGTGLYVASGGSTPMSAILASSTKIYLAQGRRRPYVYNRSNGSYAGTIGGDAGDGGCYVLLTSDTGYGYAHGQYHGTGYKANEYVDYFGTYPDGKWMVVSGQTAYVITEQFSVDKTKNDKTVVNPQLKAVNRNNNSTIWSVSCDSPYYSLIIAGDVLFAGGTNKVTAHDTSTGSELWSKPVHGRARGLAAANGNLFVSTDTGRIYMFGRPYLQADFNGDGKVNFKDFSILAQYWFEDEPLVDIAPAPLGDDIVDFKDLAVFVEYWLKEVEPVVVGLLAHWKLDETEGTIAHDNAGNKDGTVNGEPTWQPTGGLVDGALQFDGTDDYVSMPFVLNPAAGAFSAFAWIKAGAPGQVIISQMAGITRYGVTWLCTDPTDGKLMTKLMYPQPTLVSDFVITDGQWHHIGLVWDGSRRYLYADGAEVAKDTDVVGSTSVKGGLFLGAGEMLTAASFFSGLIDDVCIYNRAVTP